MEPFKIADYIADLPKAYIYLFNLSLKQNTPATTITAARPAGKCCYCNTREGISISAVDNRGFAGATRRGRNRTAMDGLAM